MRYVDFAMVRHTARAMMACCALGCSLEGIADGQRPAGAGGGSATSTSSTGSRGEASEGGGQHAFAWIRGYGSDADQGTVDGETSKLFAASFGGGVVLSASTLSAIDFGGHEPEGAPGVNNAFIALLSPTGEYAWSLALKGTAAVKEISGTAVAPDGRIAVVGRFQGGTVILESTELNCPSNRGDGFVYVLDASKQLLGARHLKKADDTSDDDQVPLGVAFDREGGLYITGRFKTSLVVADEAGLADMGCGPLKAATGATEDAFVLKLDAALACQWSQAIGGAAQNESGTAVAAAPDGGVVVGGTYRGDFALPNGEILEAVNGVDAFMVRLEESGDVRWSTPVAANGNDGISALAMDETGVYVAGSFSRALTVAGCPATGAPVGVGADGIVAKLSDTTGACLWRQKLGGDQTQRISSIALAGTALAVAGSFEGQLSVGEQVLETARGSHDAYFLWLDGERGDLESRTVRGSLSTETLEAVTIAGGAVFVAGTYAEPFEGLPPANQAEDFFLGRLLARAPSAGSP